MRQHASATPDSPLTQSQLAELDNVPATVAMPAAMADRLARSRHYLTVTDPKLDLRSSLRRHADGVWEVDLPPQSFVGLRGKTGHAGFPAKSKRRRTNPAAFRPPWADQIFHPKLSGPRDTATPLLRTLDGAALQPTSNGVFGDESRQPFKPSGYPAQCIGKTYTWYNPSRTGKPVEGTGVLIGPRHVLTAAHLTPYVEREWAMLFVPGSYDGQSVVGTGANSWVSDFRVADQTKIKVGARDFCILRLFDPLGDALGYFGARTYIPDWDIWPYWALVGYPDAWAPGRPSYEVGIRVIKHATDGPYTELLHRGDGTFGNSGGPLYSIFEDGFPYVVGVFSGSPGRYGQLDANLCAGGQAMVDAINHCRDLWK